MKTNEQEQSSKKPFGARKIAGIAIFTALAYCISFLEFAIFPQVPFLKIDFSNVFIMLAGFMYGPIVALFVGVVKELLRLIGSSTFGVGEIANFSIILAYVLPPTIFYVKFKGRKVVYCLLAVACLMQTAVALLVNKFITFPLYGMADLFNSVVWFLVAFNLIKSILVSLLIIVLYKRIGRIFERMNIK